MAWSGRQAPRPAREHVPRYDHALDLTSALVDLGKAGDGGGCGGDDLFAVTMPP